MSDIDKILALFVELSDRVTDLKIRVESLRAILQDLGVPRATIETKIQELRMNWKAQEATLVDRHSKRKEADKATELRRLLEAYEGTKQ